MRYNAIWSMSHMLRFYLGSAPFFSITMYNKVPTIVKYEYDETSQMENCSEKKVIYYTVEIK